MFVGVFWSCGDAKLLLSSFLLLCSIATVIQFLPSRFHFPPPPIPSPNPFPNLHPIQHDELVSAAGGGVIKRSFTAVGSAAYLFVQMGAYRGGAATFAVVGLALKSLHVYGDPTFQCEWTPHGGGAPVAIAEGSKILPGWGYGHVYAAAVVNCSFPAAVGLDGAGGRLVLRASAAAGDPGERILALDEAPGSINATDYKFDSPPEFNYLYCGSPLYGNLNPQRIREWVAYHVRLFGERSHFVIYDAGGVHAAVMEVLRPWIEKGFVTLEDIREQERFNGYYHNQFLVINDCLHRYRFKAKWMFFFDADEFVYVEPETTLSELLDSLSGYTQFTFGQMQMSSKLCLSSDEGKTSRMWGMEKLVYRSVTRGVRKDRKYAIQPRSVFATGVHMSHNLTGRTLHKEWGIKYFHYHGTIAELQDTCHEFTNATEIIVDGTLFVRDESLRKVTGQVRRFELKAIGSKFRRTRQ